MNTNRDERFERLKERAMARRLRMTPQREVLLRALGGVRHHPSADELYRLVRKGLPSVSPATVYRNVQALVRAGVISTLERAGGAVRYDANVQEHHHFICSRCGGVEDVYLADLRYSLDRRRTLAGAEIRSAEVQFHGVCARCRRGRR